MKKMTSAERTGLLLLAAALLVFIAVSFLSVYSHDKGSDVTSEAAVVEASVDAVTDTVKLPSDSIRRTAASGRKRKAVSKTAKPSSADTHKQRDYLSEPIN